MITARVYFCHKQPCGFSIEGHSGAGQAGQDIICSAVSSAAYMAANTLTEINKAKADISVSDGFLKLMLQGEINKPDSDIIAGLLLHLKALQEQYPKFLKVITEV